MDATEVNETSNIKWRTSIPKKQITTEALVHLGKVYFGVKDKTLRCLDIETGDILWTYEGEAAMLSGPIMYDGFILIGDEDGLVHKVDADSGKSEKAYQVSEGRLSQRMVIHENLLLVGANDTYLYCIDLETGNRVWRFKTDGIIWDGPTLTLNKVLVPSIDHHLYCLSLPSGRMLWQTDLEAVLRGSCTVLGGMVYQGSGNGIMHAIDIDNGDIIWQYIVNRPIDEQLSENKSIGNAPIVTDDKVIFGCRDGVLYALDRLVGKQIWRFSTPKAIMAAPTIYQGSIYFVSYDGYVYSVNVNTGHPIWKLDLYLGSYNQPVIVADHLYMGNIGGHFYSVELTREN